MIECLLYSGAVLDSEDRPVNKTDKRPCHTPVAQNLKASGAVGRGLGQGQVQAQKEGRLQGRLYA